MEAPTNAPGELKPGESYYPSREGRKLISVAPRDMDDPSVEDGPWFFAWVEPTETTFDEETHARVDEWVFSVSIEHKEGDNPTATLEIENPGVGLLASGRLGWMWISKRKADNTVAPLFFGQLLSVPSDLLQMVVTISLVARAKDQQARKQALAQTLKVAPYYDEVWIDLSRQNDPEAVLEGYSSRWHFDRTTHEVTVSDVLEGEDGTLEFGYDDLFWDGMGLTLDNLPLSSVSLRATVNWTQKAEGTLDLPVVNVQTYAGDGFLSDWPKPYASLGHGWSAGQSMAVDVWNTAGSDSVSYSYQYRNTHQEHTPGDTLSVSVNETYPAGQGAKFQISTEFSTGGHHAWVKESYFYVLLWLVSLKLELRYQAERERKEIINFSLVNDIQDVLIPEGKEKANSDHIDVNGRNVGNPLYVRAILHGTTGANVSDGDQVLILSDPPYRFQTTLTAGEGHVHIGATLEESLTNLTNAINGAGLGEPGTDYAAENSPNATVFAAMTDASHILLTGLSSDDKILVQTTSSVLEFDATSTYTWTGGAPTNGQTVTVAGIVYTFDNTIKLANQLTLSQNIIRQVPYHVLINSNSGEGTLINFAAAINAEGGAGSTYATGTLQNPLAQAEVFNGVLTVFPRHANANMAMAGPWTLATDHMIPDQDTVPIGDVSRRAYFATDRGQQSIQALICRARARLRISSRAVKAAFVTDLENGFALSCRKNLILNDPRFAGGQAMGKVVSYYFKVNGDDGAELSGGEIGCAVGNGSTVVDDPGTPTYVEENYADLGWQLYSNQQVHLANDDIWYTPPVDTVPIDDGLVFPLTYAQAVLSSRFTARLVDQSAALAGAAGSSHLVGTGQGIAAVDWRIDHQAVSQALAQSAAKALVNSSMAYELVLVPLDGGPYSTRYEVTLSELMIPKQVDLGAE